MLNVGLIGFGKTGSAVAEVLVNTPGMRLAWIVRRQAAPDEHLPEHPEVPILSLPTEDSIGWFAQHPVDAVVDFSSADSLALYAPAIAHHGLTLVSAISAYGEAQMTQLRELGQQARVMASPNITLGINFLLLSARLMRNIAPFADVEIVEQHFRDKPEVSGTARRMAEVLEVGSERITSLRLGGIVGHHEVIFGFPHQTVRLIHDSIRREAFGTGVVFALHRLIDCPPGFYTYDDLLISQIRQALLEMGTSQTA